MVLFIPERMCCLKLVPSSFHATLGEKMNQVDHTRGGMKKVFEQTDRSYLVLTKCGI